jgi:hypothetical protein
METEERLIREGKGDGVRLTFYLRANRVNREKRGGAAHFLPRKRKWVPKGGFKWLGTKPDSAARGEAVRKPMGFIGFF